MKPSTISDKGWQEQAALQDSKEVEAENVEKEGIYTKGILSLLGDRSSELTHFKKNYHRKKKLK